MTVTRGNTKIRIGTVLSDKMDKTIVVRIDRLTKHKLYHRVIGSAVKYKAHDPENIAKTGDKVKIAQTRPISKDKRWRLVEVLK